MAEYDITSPDGRKFRITAPDDATQEQVLEYAQKNFGPAPQPEQQRPKTTQETYEDVVKKRGWGTGFAPAVEELGGKVTDVTGSPAAGVAANVVGQAIPMLFGGNVSGSAAAPVMEKGAEKLMQSALKPASRDIVSGDAARAVKTLLEQGANITSAGAAKLRSHINKLSGEVAQMIAASPATVDKAHAASEVYKTLQKFRQQVNPGADTKAILKAWEEFSQMVGAKIPVQVAQALKQGTYKVLADKYAKVGGAVDNEAATQAQMAMARGLRQGIEEAVPGVGQVNAKEAELINALELAEKRAGFAGNKDLGGIAWIASNPKAAAAMMMDRSAAFKSWLANKIYQYRNSAPAAAGAGAVGLYQASEE
jgi:hypothetical protein